MNINVGIHTSAPETRQRLRRSTTMEAPRPPKSAAHRSGSGSARRRRDDGLVGRAGPRARPRELAKIKAGGFVGKFERAAEIFTQMSTQDTFAEFLTLPLYEEL
jgi:hypothetical protein